MKKGIFATLHRSVSAWQTQTDTQAVAGPHIDAHVKHENTLAYDVLSVNVGQQRIRPVSHKLVKSLRARSHWLAESNVNNNSSWLEGIEKQRRNDDFIYKNILSFTLSWWMVPENAMFGEILLGSYSLMHRWLFLWQRCQMCYGCHPPFFLFMSCVRAPWHLDSQNQLNSQPAAEQ